MLLLYNLAFTLVAIFMCLAGGEHLNAGVFLFAKIVGLLSALGLHYYSSSQSYFYFRNAGYRMFSLFIGVAGLDILVYLLIIILPSPLQNAAAFFKNW